MKSPKTRFRRNKKLDAVLSCSGEVPKSKVKSKAKYLTATSSKKTSVRKFTSNRPTRNRARLNLNETQKVANTAYELRPSVSPKFKRNLNETASNPTLFTQLSESTRKKRQR
jgi:hypothetical protein